MALTPQQTEIFKEQLKEPQWALFFGDLREVRDMYREKILEASLRSQESIIAVSELKGAWKQLNDILSKIESL